MKKMRKDEKKSPADFNALFETADKESGFADKIFNTVRDPLLLLDKDLRVIKASRSFYDFFKVTSNKTIGKLIYDLGNRQWDIPKLRELLETILPEKTTFNNYEVEHDFSKIGKRIMILNARKIPRGSSEDQMILLAIEDITERKHKEESLSEKSRLTNEYLNILLNHAHVPIIIWNSSMVITRINHEFEKLIGYDWTEVQGKKIDFLFPKENLESTMELLKSTISNRKVEVMEIDLIAKDKKTKTVIWNSANILDKKREKIVATIAQDVTSHKLIERALSIQETRYRRLFETAKDGILILDAETGMIIDVNPFLIELLGYTKEQFVNKEIWEIGFFKDIAANKEKFNELQQKKYVRYEDLPLETVEGKKIHVEFVSNVYMVNQNKVIQCNIRDNTKRKLAEDALSESEKNYRELINGMNETVWVIDFNGKLLEVNNTAVNVLGYSKEELLTNGLYGIDSTLKKEEIIDLVKSMPADKLQIFETTHTTKDGRTIPVEVYSSLMTYRGKGAILSIARDITERKHTEEEVLMLAQSLRCIKECVSITDFEDKIIFVNDSFLKTYGYGESDIVGKNMNVVRSRNNSPEIVNEILPATLKGSWSGELWNKRKDESEFPVYLSTTIINDKDGKALGLIGVASDITEQKQIEKELIDAKEKAEESDKLKSEFLAQMSHEIRTPINVMIGNVDYLNQCFNEKMDPDIKDCFDGIELASKRIIRTINLILDAAELQTSGYKPQFTEVDLDREILINLTQEYQLSAKQKGLELNYQCGIKNTIIFADGYSVKQIFANLIDNAIKYTKNGKVDILLSNRDKNKIIVEVKDSGIGISKEFMPRLFDPFAQEEQGYTRRFEGNGLGLALVKKYCEINKATIEVDSKKNVGTTFSVIFN